jgi:exodeoxyribonuclease X
VLLPRVLFGKYRGSAWTEVPVDYLDWITDRSDLNDDVKFTASHYRRAFGRDTAVTSTDA